VFSTETSLLQFPSDITFTIHDEYKYIYIYIYIYICIYIISTADSFFAVNQYKYSHAFTSQDFTHLWVWSLMTWTCVRFCGGCERLANKKLVLSTESYNLLRLYKSSCWIFKDNFNSQNLWDVHFSENVFFFLLLATVNRSLVAQHIFHPKTHQSSHQHVFIQATASSTHV
jgi:hypothetical protein